MVAGWPKFQGERGTKNGRWRKRRRGWLLLGPRLQRSAEFFSRIRAKFLRGSRRAGWYRGMSSKARRIMAGMPATTLLEESCSMTLHLDRLRPLWSMGVRLCAAWMSRVRIPFDGSSTQGLAGLCAWDMGIMDYRVFLGVVWGFQRDIYRYIQEIIRKVIRYMRLIEVGEKYGRNDEMCVLLLFLRSMFIILLYS